MSSYSEQVSSSNQPRVHTPENIDEEMIPPLTVSLSLSSELH